MKIGTQRVCQLVQSLRSFSRVDEAALKTVDIHSGIESTLLILNHRLKPSPCRPEIQVIKKYGDLPLVECYAGQLNQVFMNVLVNAIEALEDGVAEGTLKPLRGDRPGFSAKNSPPLHIHIQTSLLPTDRLLIQIRDTGPGIPHAIQSRLFDPFFTTKAIGQGTGLGLSICYKIIVETHHGEIRCLSTPGQGSEFQIEIPVSQTGI